MRKAIPVKVRAWLNAMIKLAEAVRRSPADDDDLETILMARSPRFQAIFEQSRQSLRAGGGLGEDDLWNAVEKQGSLSSE